MPHLSYVYPYPATGYADRPCHDDPVADVAVRALRSVTELYSEALERLGLPSRTSQLRIFTSHGADQEDVRGTVQVDPGESFETAHVRVPSSLAALTPEARAEVLLEVVHGIVVRLAESRGWDVRLLDGCRQHVVDAGLEFAWTSPAKTSPDRRLAARAHFRLLPDGFGRTHLEVVRRDDASPVARSEEAVAFCTSPGFRRAASSLRWHGSGEVSMVPFDFGGSFRGGRVALVRDGDDWRSVVEEHTSVLAVPGGDPSTRRPPVIVEGRGGTAPEQPYDAYFVGGGPMEGPATERHFERLRAQLRALGTEEGLAWWREQDRARVLEVQVDYSPGYAEARGRVGRGRLKVMVVRPSASLEAGDPVDLADEDVASVVALVRRRTGLGPHPVVGNAGGR